MKQTLGDLGLNFDHIHIWCDNKNVINLTKNCIQHSRTNQIEILHHFLHDHLRKDDIVLEFVCTDKPLMNIFTKPLNEERFCMIRREIDMIGSNLI